MRRTLFVPAFANSTAELLADAAAERGMDVQRLSAGSTATATQAAHVYGGPLFAAALAAEFDIALLEPADDWLVQLPYEFLRREIYATTLGDARWLREPAFVKQPRDKDLPAAVYADGSRLPDGQPSMPVLVSEIVTFIAEYRLFLLDGRVHAGSRYATFGRLDPLELRLSPHHDEVLDFAAQLLDAYGNTLPSAVVLDVGLATTPEQTDEHWAVVEANMAWYANAYAADTDAVLDVVLRAAGPLSEVSERDRAYIRTAIDT